MAPPPLGMVEPIMQMNKYCSYVTMLADPNVKDENKLKAAQELSENYEIILASQQYPQFLEHSMKIFVKILNEGQPHFISEYTVHQVRKLLLELIYRMPVNDILRPYTETVLMLCMHLIESDNEENVLICLRIIIELNKHYRPAFTDVKPFITHFLNLVRSIYRELPNHMDNMFKPRPPPQVNDLSELDVESLLQMTYISTEILCKKGELAEGSGVNESYTLIPKGVVSLKVLQELPILIVLLYQLYKEHMEPELTSYIPVILHTITLQPALEYRLHPNFNKKVFADFMGAQIKSLSFLAYVLRLFQEAVSKQTDVMVEGMINMLTLCPMEVTNLRKELLIAARHILSTDLKIKFVPYMSRLCDEKVLLGNGWTTHESLRPPAFSMLADLVLNVRQHLPMADLERAVHLFSVNIHDETLPTSIQTISCKLLLNLVECVRQKGDDDKGSGHELLLQMLRVFVLKFKTVARLHLPALINKSKAQTAQQNPVAAVPQASAETKNEDVKVPIVGQQNPMDNQAKREKPDVNKPRFGFPATQTANYNIVECRALVKALVYGVKTIMMSCSNNKSGDAGGTKTLQACDPEVLIKLVKWALQALDIYTLTFTPTLPAMQRMIPPKQFVRSKEEKEVLEHFSSIFALLNPQVFREIFLTTIEYMVERIAGNYALQVIGNWFLTNLDTSPIFAPVLVEYLLGRMVEMGNGNAERSNLYLKLFKSVFESVQCFPTQNEHMLRPHLHKIVNRSMELAMTAKEPYNYFLLLRALFRSIGEGRHDLLYQEFLPLLPSLLQGLNSLQSGLHKQHMKDLFVELCLTVPVRLSSLLPYLPMLMDPLVSALNGSHTLISQGLRTLELCVDNLQPDFLYEHIQPVRADLMQALWRSLRYPTDQNAHVAFRVLGKFGGGNRKMMTEPQRLEYNNRGGLPPAIVVQFPEHSKPIQLPIDKILETAVNFLKSPTTELFYRRQCWEIVKSYTVASIRLDDDRLSMLKLFSHPSFTEGDIPHIQGSPYKCADKPCRDTHLTALTGLFIGASIKDLKKIASPFLIAVVRHYTMVAVAQQAGLFAIGGKQSRLEGGMDVIVLIDALAAVMGHEKKDVSRVIVPSLILIIDTATTLLGSKERAFRLPLMEYLAERMCALCYDRAWYAKLSGCQAIKFFYEDGWHRISARWIYQHLFVFMKAQLFVMMDLNGEVSSGAIDEAKQNLEKMIRRCGAPIEPGTDPELEAIQKKALGEVTYELIRQITSPTDLLREQSIHLLKVFAEMQGKTVPEVMEPHRDVLTVIISPKKNLLRHQAANAQIGLMEGNTFCSSLVPRLFTLDLEVELNKTFFNELRNLCSTQDQMLLKLPCYKSVSNLVPLRKAAMRVLAACHYIPAVTDKVFLSLYQALDKPNPELQEAAFECMKTFIAGAELDRALIRDALRPLLTTLSDVRSLHVSGARRLSYLVQLFPHSFNEKFCEQLLEHLHKLFNNLVQQQQQGGTKNGNMEEIIAIIINIFHEAPAASVRFIEPLTQLILQSEKSLNIGPSSPFREPLFKFLLRYPKETVDLVLQDKNVKESCWSKYLAFITKHKSGKPFRDVLQSDEGVQKLIQMVKAPVDYQSNLTEEEKEELRFQGVRIVAWLIKFDDQWLSSQFTLVDSLTEIWCDNQYQERHRKIETVSCAHWKEPQLLVDILLHFFSHHPTKIDLLFQLLRAVIGRFLPSFQKLHNFLETAVAQDYTVEWKRSAFFKFVELYQTPNVCEELVAKILQFIIIPCFSVCFECGKGDQLILGSDGHNIVSVFINDVIDIKESSKRADCVRTLVLQLACLLVEQAPHHIPCNKNNREQLQRLMTYAWPSLLNRNCMDPATRYHGHLLIAFIITKFNVFKRIVSQVFRSLLKAYSMEIRGVVRQALDILTPALPTKMNDGYATLAHSTKKIIVEEGHSMQQLYHICSIVVRHYKVYYPVRHHLVQSMITSIQRLGFTQSATIEHRKLAVELAEVIIKWELQRIKDENEPTDANIAAGIRKRPSVDDAGPPAKRIATGVSTPTPFAASGSSQEDLDVLKPIEKTHANAVLNFLARLACQLNENSAGTSAIPSQGELLSRRCIALIRMALKPDVWPQQNLDLRLAWLDKVFATVESQNANLANVCTALELFTFLITVMRKEQILATCKSLPNISSCIACSNTKVVRLVHGLLSRLMALFPTEPATSQVASKHEELECLYSCVSKVIYEGLANYEKSGNTNTLFRTVMALKAACSSNPSYVDRLVGQFVRVLQRLAREHLASLISHTSAETPNENPQLIRIGTNELLILCLDLVKNRVGGMSGETRKTFLFTIIIGLIEKTSDIKIMRTILKIIEDWMNGPNVQGSPTLREKSMLLIKLMQFVEKKFPDLNTQFLELVNNIYRDEVLKSSELTIKLEPAFLSGLRCMVPALRAKFFDVLDRSMRRRLLDRLLYIVAAQNWEPMGHHYWLKQCIELIMVTASQTTQLQLAGETTSLLPCVTSVINLAEPNDRDNFVVFACPKEEMPDSSMSETSIEDLGDLELIGNDADTVVVKQEPGVGVAGLTREANLQKLIGFQAKFLETVRETKTVNILGAIAQLGHMDTTLAESIWLDMFPRLWGILSERQQSILGGEIVAFIGSGIHVVQRDSHPSAICTFYESLAHCNPQISLKPVMMTYLGKSHNLWHRVTLQLEQAVIDQQLVDGAKKKWETVDCYDFEPDNSPQQDLIDNLAEMYSRLREEDMWAGLLQKHAKHPETSMALAYEQQGFFEQALTMYETIISKSRQELSSDPAPMSERRLWERQWIRCTKELNQWDNLLEFAKTKGNVNPFLVLESAWRVPNWSLMEEALSHVDMSCPKELMWKVNLYRGFLAICHSDQLDMSVVERYVKLASGLCMREWRQLPHIVSHIHLPLLQAAQQIMELQEAAMIHQGILSGRNSTNSLHDMKATVKTWRNRLPVIADDLSHWSDVFTWRQHHYQHISTSFANQQDQPSNTHSIVGVHASAEAIVHFGKIARKHNLTGVCLDSLSRLYTIPTVPIVDCFHKIKQHVKCYLQMKSELQEGLEVIKCTKLCFLTKEMKAEFFALEGMLLSQTGRMEEANKAFSTAVQMHDTLVKAWALWGEHMETQFTQNPTDMATGAAAITCFLHACRHQNESKSRKYLAKVLWLLTYDNDKFALMDAVDKYSVGVPPVQWLPWIPQLLTCLVRNEGTLVLNLLTQVGRMYPQAVFFPIRTLFLTLKIEQRERFKQSEAAEKQQANLQSVSGVTESAQQGKFLPSNKMGTNPDTGPIKATPAMWRCSRIMNNLREIHPTTLLSLEGIVDQMIWFRENWYEEVLRQLRQGLTKCYGIAFENRGAVNDATITPHTLNFVNKMVATFGLGVENISNSINSSCANAGSESMAIRAHNTIQDPVFQRMKMSFTADFDFTMPGAMKLHNIITKLKKWIKIIDARTKILPKSFLLEEKCRFLSNFSLQTAEVELPGEFLLPKYTHYQVRIARFLPRVEIVQKHNAAARRLLIRGHNGKIYPYLVIYDSGLGDARREERLLQLMRMLNHYLSKQKETARRFLQMTVPRVVAASSQMRLVEDNPSSISLLDIYQKSCQRLCIDHDVPLINYYTRLATIQSRGSQASQQVLRDFLMEVQSNVIPRTLLKEWALRTYVGPTDYWTFRKVLTSQLSLACFVEYVLHLTRLNPDMMLIHQDSGLVNIAYFKFDIDENKGELDANRPVPFRLTPNISELLSEVGVSGPLTASMIATARCFSQPNFKVQTILRAILKDEMLVACYKKVNSRPTDEEGIPHTTGDVPGEMIINLVTKAVTAISNRLNALTTVDGADSKVSTLVAAAKSTDNLCRMDPAWYPWL
nr:PREDICTED: transformation/transcription domain-associated protein isoform X3 [Bemisia tabaci]